MVDYLIHYVKANGSTSPHVFKLAKRRIAPGKGITLARRHSFGQITARKYYPGVHALELQVNGHRVGRVNFTLGKPSSQHDSPGQRGAGSAG